MTNVDIYMYRIINKISVIPITIFVVISVLSITADAVWNLICSKYSFSLISTVQAQSAAKEKVTRSSSANNDIKPSTPLSAENQELDDPTLFTQNDIKDLQKLAKRRQHIEALFDELTMRERLLGAAEKRIDKKILEMKRLIVALQKSIKIK